VAVFLGAEILASESLDIGRRQAAELPLVVERVLAAANRRVEDIGLVAVTNGPGYFTGVRVGAAYAAALAYGLGVGVVPVSTLEMLAFPHIEADETTTVLALVYAGRGRVYAASFGPGAGSPDTGLPDAGLPAGEYGLAALEAWLSRRAGRKTTLVSDDPQKAAEALGSEALGSETLGLTSSKEDARPLVLSLPILPSPPDACAVARIAWRERSTAVSPMALRVSYLREPQIG
jgi:tRNA threonylcarbamoyl adenosine modification protein YeaZ